MSPISPRRRWQVRGLSCTLLLALIVACSPALPAQSPAHRIWQGPTQAVSSVGLTFYERRELAQRVAFPTCITVSHVFFRFAEVQALPSGAPVPPGLLDTGYGRERWRLLAPAGALEEHAELFVSVRGSTGILGRYPRLPAGQTC